MMFLAGVAYVQDVLQWLYYVILNPSYLVQYTMYKLYSFFFSSSVIAVVTSKTIGEINGPAFRSPLVGQTLLNLTGIVIAKGPSGFYIKDDSAYNGNVSKGLLVYTSSDIILSQVAVGDAITLSGGISEYRSPYAPNDLFLTQLDGPADIIVLSKNNTVAPIILGKDRKPPTSLYSALDAGEDGFLSVPNNSSLMMTVNETLQPSKFGLDFWESLVGELVTIPKPTSTAFQNKFGDLWVYGDWPVTGKNSRGGLTLTFGEHGIPDGNPEAIVIGRPLDSTKNPQAAVGFGLSDIVGVVTYAHGFYTVLPLTAPSIIFTPSLRVPNTPLKSKSSDACSITFGDYNVENLAPTSSHLQLVADHIATYLCTPDIMFLQEIQDNSGPTDDGTVSSNVTLAILVEAIAKISNVIYNFTVIDPVDGQDGGQPGSNIRNAYLYRSDRLSLVKGSPVGGALDKTEVISGPLGKPRLSFNPGRIDPTNRAWNATRKPLVAAWNMHSGAQLYTINVHLSSKGGSSSTQGDARTPFNSALDARTNQLASVATFVQSLLNEVSQANIMLAGDFNEFIQTRSAFKTLQTLLLNIDEVAQVPVVERYTYIFDQNSEQLDHVFISPALSYHKAEIEHIHINNWASSLSSRVSDHDPSVGRVRVC